MDLEQYRRTSHDIWGEMAPGWDERRDWIWEVSRAVGEWMVAKLDPQPGQRILELAAGAGDTGFAAASLLGDEGRLISTDFSADMVEVARKRGAELGLDNIDYRVMDAERMDLDSDSVDGVLCRWGYMLMADPAAALGETRRVLRPGGRVAFSVWAEPERNPWATTPMGVLVSAGHVPAPEPGAPGLFSMSSRERIEELVTQAGFDTPEIEEVEVTFTFTDFDDYWNFVNKLAGAVAMAIASLPNEAQAQVKADTERQAESLRSDGGYTMPGVTLNALAS
jgi:ubiquinone/menaquinone biosynthesis C-methylase UbiE